MISLRAQNCARVLCLFLVMCLCTAHPIDANTTNDTDCELMPVACIGLTDHSVVMHGDFAYISRGYEGIGIYDISDPTNPVEHPSKFFDAAISELLIVDGYLYATAGYKGFLIIDISNPSVPSLLVQVQTEGHVDRISIADATAYVVDNIHPQVAVYDVTTPTEPEFVCNIIDEELEYSSRAVGLNHHVYAIEDNERILVFDFSDPGDVQLVNDIEAPLWGTGLTLDPDRKLLYQYNIGALAVMSVEDPLQPTEIAFLDIPNDYFEFRFQHPICHLRGSDSFSTIDLTDPLNPQFHEGPQGFGPTGNGFAIQNQLGCIINQALGLRTLDFSDPLEPIVLAERIGRGGGGQFIIDGNMLYRFGQGPAGLQVFDIHDPVEFRNIGANASEIEVRTTAFDDGIAYIADEFGTIFTFDLTDPSAPQIIGQVPGASLGEDVALVAQDGWCYAIADHQLSIIDATEPSMPFVSAALEFDDRLRSASIDGDMLFVLSNAGLTAFDRTIPDQLVQTDEFLGYFGQSPLVATPTRVYLGPSMVSGNEFVAIFERDSAGSIQYLSAFELPQFSRTMDVKNDIVVVVTSNDTLTLFDARDPHDIAAIGETQLRSSAHWSPQINRYHAYIHLTYLGGTAAINLTDCLADLCLEDIDRNNAVDVTDLITLIGNWGPCDNHHHCPADLNDDSTINTEDLLQLLSAWGPCYF